MSDAAWTARLLISRYEEMLYSLLGFWTLAWGVAKGFLSTIDESSHLGYLVFMQWLYAE